jgi:NTP pyrophosphatase (non-canonical NTP hydrolase)
MGIKPDLSAPIRFVTPCEHCQRGSLPPIGHPDDICPACGGCGQVHYIKLGTLQRLQKDWSDYNFPGQTPSQSLLGMTEELGEIAHSVLKYQQGIRGANAVSLKADIKDGIGDFCMFAMQLCNHYGISFAECLETAWHEIKTRDWVQFPENGKDK